MSNYATNEIISFCTTGQNEETLSLVREKLEDMSSRATMAIRNCVNDIESDSQEAYGREVRDFVASCILEFDEEYFSPDYSGYFDYISDSIKSMRGSRKDFPAMMRSSNVRRAYLGFTLAVMRVEDIMVPDEQRLLVMHRMVNGTPHYRYRDHEVISLVCEYPDRWEEIARLATKHNIRYAPAIKEILKENVASALGAGVL